MCVMLPIIWYCIFLRYYVFNRTMCFDMHIQIRFDPIDRPSSWLDQMPGAMQFACNRLNAVRLSLPIHYVHFAARSEYANTFSFVSWYACQHRASCLLEHGLVPHPALLENKSATTSAQVSCYTKGTQETQEHCFHASVCLEAIALHISLTT